MATNRVIIRIEAIQKGIAAAQASIARLQALALGASAATGILGAGAQAVAGGFAAAAVAAAAVGVAAVGAAAIGTAALLGMGAAVAGIGIAAAASSKAVKDAYKGLGKYLGTQVQQAAKPIQDVLVNNVQTIKDAFVTLRPYLQDTFKDVAGFVSTAFGQLKPIAASLGNLFKTGFGAARPFLEQLVAGIAPLLDSFTTFFGVLKTNTPQLLAFTGALGGVLTGVLPIVGQLITALTPIATQVVQGIIPAFQGLANIVIALAPVFTAFQSVTAGLIKVLTPAFQALGAVLPGVATALGQMLQNLNGGALAAVFTALGNAVIAIAPAFGQLVNAVLPLIPTLVAVLVPTFINLVGILTTLTPIVNAVFGFFADHPNLFTALVIGGIAFAGALKVLSIAMAVAEAAIIGVEIALAILASPVTIVIAVIALLVAAFVLAYQHSEAFRNGVDSMVATVKKNFNQLKTDATTMGNTIRDNFNQLKSDFNGIKSAISGFVSSVVGFFKSMGSGIASGVSSAISAVSSIPGRIKGALGNVGGMLYGAGRAIIQGLLNGISSLAGAVANKAREIANTVKNAAKSALGIHSPSRVFLEIGQNVNRGLVKGLAQVAGVKTASANLGSTVSSSFGTPDLSVKGDVFSGSSALAGGSTINLNVNVPVGGNAVETGREVYKVLKPYLNASGRTV